MASSNGLTFDQALVSGVGELGRGQLVILLLVSLCNIANAFVVLLMVFNNKNPVKEHWFVCTGPTDTMCQQIYSLQDPSTEFCKMSNGQWDWTEPSRSIVSQFNLICSAAWKTQLVNSAFFVGYLVGSGLFGYLADAWGRKPTLLSSSIVCVIFTAVESFSSNYWFYFVLRLATGIGAAGQAVACYILATEMIGPSWRGAAGITNQMFFIFGEFALVLFAYLFQGWRELCLVTAVITATTLPMFMFVPESARWLQAKGRNEKATAVLAKVCAWNRTTMPSQPLAEPQQSAGAKMGLGQVLKDKHIRRRFIVLAYAWLVLCLTYYGISLALNGLKGSIYVVFLVTSVAELFSYLTSGWLIEKLGRHNTMAAGMLLCGLSCVVCAFIPAGIGQSITAALGKFGCAGAFAIASVFTSELFPTLVRSAVLGAQNEAARIGGIAAPFVVLLGTNLHSNELPFLVFGLTSVTAGAGIFTLPETLGLATPDTMQDMSNIRSIFSNQTWKHGWKAATKSLFKTRAKVSAVSGGAVECAPVDEEQGSLLADHKQSSTEHS